MLDLTANLRTSIATPADDEGGDVHWTVALAGGEGQRLAAYVERRFGQRMPKQYCRLLGKRSMLEHTIDRMLTLTPAARTLAVIGEHHAAHAAPQLAGRADHVFRQPGSRDTGVALYVALAMIKRYHPHAIVTLTPTDHYVAPAERYIDAVRGARAVAGVLRDTVVMLGARPTEPDPELGYLVLGDRISEVPQVSRLAAFVEKPTVVDALRLNAGGALWNTMVTCGSIDALWEVGRISQPALMDVLDAFVPLVGGPEEREALEYIYDEMPAVSFSRDMLERAPARLAAMELEGVEWSDWGKPERIETVLAIRRQRRAARAAVVGGELGAQLN